MFVNNLGARYLAIGRNSRFSHFFRLKAASGRLPRVNIRSLFDILFQTIAMKTFPWKKTFFCFLSIIVAIWSISSNG